MVTVQGGSGCKADLYKATLKGEGPGLYFWVRWTRGGSRLWHFHMGISEPQFLRQENGHDNNISFPVFKEIKAPD